VHEEDRALGQHLVEEVVEQLGPLGQRDRLVPDLLEGLLAELVQAHVQGEEDVPFDSKW